MIAGIELGGTKTVVAIGEADGTVLHEHRFPTTDPATTLDNACRWISSHGVPAAIGVGAFGPVGVNPDRSGYGSILATPKAGWNDFPLLGALANAFPDARLALDTDVNAAALAEATCGAAAGMNDIAYITIGTGIGAGVLTGGRLVHGALHPEFGHLKVPRMAGDDFAGVCPFHGDCLEGLASGTAMGARWKNPSHELPSDHPAWDMEAWYLANGILSLVAIVCPSKVLVGGGVSQSPGLHGKIHKALIAAAGGYFPVVNEPHYIVPPDLGQQAGIRGALLLTRGI